MMPEANSATPLVALPRRKGESSMKAGNLAFKRMSTRPRSGAQMTGSRRAPDAHATDHGDPGGRPAKLDAMGLGDGSGA
jgi:hypothetical protein